MKAAERILKCATVYEVLQGNVVVCSWRMALSKREANEKMDNERATRGGSDWNIRQRRVMVEQ